MVLVCWLASKLTRPEPHKESMGYCQEENENQETKNADELKATVKETWASIPPQQWHKWITSMRRRIEAVIKAKGAPTLWKHTFQKANNSIKMFFFFIGLMKYSNLLR